jgi:hypothetical protein
MSVLSSVGSASAAVVGRVLGGLVGGMAAVRPAAKPMHPKGCVRQGRMFRRGATPATGVPFLDDAGTIDVVVRESRAIGLPRSLPDVQGLAIRVPDQDGTHGDLLFSTTGLGRITRYVLTLSRTPYGRPMTTLLPFDTVAGPVVLAARASGDSRLELAFAVGDGDWQHFADLLLSTRRDDDPDLTFDPVLNTVAGLEQYAAVRKLRAPAYRTARASRAEA